MMVFAAHLCLRLVGTAAFWHKEQLAQSAGQEACSVSQRIVVAAMARMVALHADVLAQ
jgi:hypothetical protein